MPLRPGISDKTLERLKIREISAFEAKKLTGLEEAGIYIPFKGITDYGGDYGRLRLKRPQGSKKYHQRFKTKVHNYIQQGLTLKGDALLLVEGEFKAISLTEAGFPAVGTSGFYSWGIKNEDEQGRQNLDKQRVLHPEIKGLIERLKPERVIFIGDPDTALNWSFADAMNGFATLLRPLALSLALVRIPYDAPDGKGVDDIREKMGAKAFAKWFQAALQKAETIKPKSLEDIVDFLITREVETFPLLTGDKREKAIDQATKLYASLSETHNGKKYSPTRRDKAEHLAVRVKALAIDDLKISEEKFMEIVEAVQKKRKIERDKQREGEATRNLEQKLKQEEGDQRKAEAEPAASTSTPLESTDSTVAEEFISADSSTSGGHASADSTPALPELPSPDTATTDSLIPGKEQALEDVVMVGEKYYAYSYSKVGTGYRRSDVRSVCNRNYVIQVLKAAGFSKKDPSTVNLPVVGRIPNLNQIDAALFYLHATRCAGTTSLLFRPYGPITQPDGTRLFNTSLVRVMEPEGNVTGFGDPLIRPIIIWLIQFFGNWQPLEHFISLLSYTYKAARAGAPKKTRAVFFIGPPNSGKSLLIDKIIPLIFGQTSAADAHRLIKGEAGTTSILNSYVCKLSDKDLGNEVQRVQQGILSLLADHTMGGRALYEDVKTVDVINLFMFSSNPDGSVIKILQGMPLSIIEKFAIYEGDSTMANATALYNTQFGQSKSTGWKSDEDLIAKVIECLPHFCSFLKNWSDTKYSEPRFGVCPYVPEKFMQSLSLDSKEEAVKNMLLAYGDFRSDSGSAIHKILYKNEDNQELLDLIEPYHMVAILSRLAEVEPDLVTRKDYEKSKVFTVTTASYNAAIDKK